MSQNKRNRGGVPKTPRKKSTFDKSACRRFAVSFTDPGFQALENFNTRCWVEWEARPDVVGPDRRAFIGRDGADSTAAILQHGDKLPRKGMSCCLEGRRVLVLGPGVLHIWRMPITGTTKQDGVPVWDPPPGTVAPPRNRTGDDDDDIAD